MDEKIKILSRYNFWDSNIPDLGFVRKSYIDILSRLSGNNRLVKVLVGQRRVGKSYVLRQFASWLIEQGVNARNIFILNKELEIFDFVSDSDDLRDLLDCYINQIKPEGKIYIFLDEVQNIKSWERFVNSFSQDYTREYELFITGSNSKMLSGELATMLSGRYVEVEVSPFSYEEFLGFHEKSVGRETYLQYMHSSGLPETYKLNDDETRRYYVKSLKNTVMLRDIVGRYGVRDVALLEDLFVYIINNASNLMSISNIVKYMKGKGRKVSYDTVSTYIGYLEDAYLLYQVNRYNIKGKSVIGGVAKYYANDLAFRNYLYRGFGYGEGYLLENVVYMELRRMGFDLYVGSVEGKEVDFIGIIADRKIYVQVSYSIAEEETARREYSPLEDIKDSFEKYVITMDDFLMPIHEGIRHLRAWEIGSIDTK